MLDVLRWYVLSCLLLAIVGFIQLTIWYATGKDPMPIGFIGSLLTPSSIDIRSGMFYFEDKNVYRMSSLGGEPKNLGQGVALGLLILIWGYVNNVRILNNGTKVVAFLLFTALFFTQSTSAFISFAVGFFGLIAFSSNASKKSISILVKLGFWLIIAFILLIFFGNSLLNFSVLDLIEIRTITRASTSETGYLDDFDAAIVDYLRSDQLAILFGSGLGNVHLFADRFLPEEVATYAGGTSFTAKSGIIKIVSEVGLIGLTLFRFFLLSNLEKA